MNIIDISDPLSPTLKGSFQTGEYPDDIQVVGDYAYVLSGGEFQIFNVSDKNAPSRESSIATADEVLWLHVAGDYAYVTVEVEEEDYTESYALQVIDITNPVSPTVTGSFTTTDVARDVYVVDNYAYLTIANQGLQVIDISEPSTPTLTGSLETTHNFSVYVVGTYAYVTDYYGGLYIIDISDPAKPTLVGDIETPNGGRNVQIVGTYAYVQGGRFVQVIDVSTPSNPTYIGSFDMSAMRHMFVVGTNAYAVGDELQVIDISNPVNLNVESTDAPLPYANDAQVVGTYAYVAAGSSGLQVLDISDPATPMLKGSVATPSDANYVQVLGDYVYVVCDDSLQVIHITDPANPVLTGSIDIPDVEAMHVLGDYAYIAIYTGNTDDRLQIIDISTPSSPVLVGEVTGNGTKDVFVVGNYAYIADGISRLVVADVSDPANPAWAGGTDPLDYYYPRGVYVANGYAYVAGWYSSNSLLVIDVNDPENPQSVGSVEVEGSFTNMHVVGDYAYVASSKGLQLVYIADPTNPVLAGRFDTSVNSVHVVDNIAYIADGSNGLQIVRVTFGNSEPISTPTPTGTVIAYTPTPTSTVIAYTPTPTGTVEAGTPTPTGTVEAGIPTPTAMPGDDEPSLDSNYDKGAPGSRFIITALGFPASSSAVIEIQGPEDDTYTEMARLTVNSAGMLIFVVFISDRSPEGTYKIRITVSGETTLAEDIVRELELAVDANEPQRTDEPSTNDVPMVKVGIREVFLPLVRR